MLELVLWFLMRILAAAPEPAPQAVEFARDVRPILEKRCQPCHFTGGKMYARLPFDRAETVDALGTKLFTRARGDRSQMCDVSNCLNTLTDLPGAPPGGGFLPFADSRTLHPRTSCNTTAGPVTPK